MTGADRLLAEGWEAATGIPAAPIGIVTNHTGRLSDGTHLVDALLEAGLPVAAIFSPEHGFEGAAREGARIYSAGEAYRGVPIRSLYGTTTRPTKEMMEGIAVLLFDIQDVGARFYTYTSTMARTMEAAAEHNLPYVVLDRPNPIGGQRAEGPILEGEYASFVGLFPVPVRHGFTVGEYARFMVGEELFPGAQGLDLRVVEMEGWDRSMYFESSDVPWVAPSPNMRTPATAVVYPGTCFIEGTNISEGRGTERPFELIGAPWADGERIAAGLNALGLPGIRFQPTTFTPGLPDFSVEVKLKGQPCSGIELVVTDREIFESVRTGLEVVAAFRRDNREEFRWRGAHFDRLAGVGWLREGIEADLPVSELADRWQDLLEAWQERAEYYLIYD
jgi:beta-N-acetylhexosaminidase